MEALYEGETGGTFSPSGINRGGGYHMGLDPHRRPFPIDSVLRRETRRRGLDLRRIYRRHMQIGAVHRERMTPP